MKRNWSLPCLEILALAMLLFACRKPDPDMHAQSIVTSWNDSTILPLSDTLAATIPYPVAPLSGCTYDPNYGDSIIYLQPNNGQDYVVTPVNNPGPGKYLSWPAGLMIDSVTGAIDVTQSNTGERYAIGFVKEGTTDTCLSPLIIGGAAYIDSIYVLADNATQSLPYFDANPSLASICGSQANGSNSCSFDVTGSAAGQAVIVNPSTGEIDLQKTLDGVSPGIDGAFGKKPKNGDLISATIFYRLNDASNMALQHITIDLVYFNNESNINNGQIQKINKKHDEALTRQLIMGGGNPRPPLIVIVRRL